MTAADFQSELQRITTMSQEEVEELLSGFLAARKAFVAARGGNAPGDS